MIFLVIPDLGVTKQFIELVIQSHLRLREKLMAERRFLKRIAKPTINIKQRARRLREN